MLVLWRLAIEAITRFSLFYFFEKIGFMYFYLAKMIEREKRKREFWVKLGKGGGSRFAFIAWLQPSLEIGAAIDNFLQFNQLIQPQDL
jgi:hypothetical protein